MKYAGIVLLAIALAMVIPVSGVSGGFDWCYHQDIMLWNASSDISGYRIFDHIPEPSIQRSIKSPSVTSATGEKTLGTWLTPAFTDTTIIAPGRWIFRMYASATSDSGTTSMRYRLFNRSSDGTITYLFFGNAISTDINQGTVPSEYSTYYARRNYTTLFPGDRLGLQINVSTDSAAPRLVTLDVAGNTNASYISSGYWICPDNTVVNQSIAHDPTEGKSAPWLLWILSGITGIILIVIALTRPKTQRMDYETNIIISVMAWPFIWYFTWGGLTSVDYIVGAGSSASTDITVMITQHILYSFWVIGWIGVAGCIFAAFVTILLISQYNLFKDNEAEAAATRQQKERMNETQQEKEHETRH
jgi:hypothetical protein